jgi:hypothetical protein
MDIFRKVPNLLKKRELIPLVEISITLPSLPRQKTSTGLPAVSTPPYEPVCVPRHTSRARILSFAENMFWILAAGSSRSSVLRFHVPFVRGLTRHGYFALPNYPRDGDGGLRRCLFTPRQAFSLRRSPPVQEFLPGFAAPDAGRPLGHDVRSGACFGVPDLHEDPALLAGPGQRKAAR